jgi:DUF1365 family protein
VSASALYVGAVTHQRFRPKRHRLRYRLFQALLDLDEVDALAARLRLFSRNRFNLFAFYDRDHGDGSARPLREQIETELRSVGIEPDGGPIRLMTMPRILGHVFNPISIYFCHRRDGSVAALVHEVTNTFKERRFYVLAAEADGDVIRQQCGKSLYVSPFLDMDLSYAFAVRQPGETVDVRIEATDGEGTILAAHFGGSRRELGDWALVREFVRHPLMTLKVVAGIHWEALLLLLKGVGVRRHAKPSPRRGVGFSGPRSRLP